MVLCDAWPGFASPEEGGDVRAQGAWVVGGVWEAWCSIGGEGRQVWVMCVNGVDSCLVGCGCGDGPIKFDGCGEFVGEVCRGALLG